MLIIIRRKWFHSFEIALTTGPPVVCQTNIKSSVTFQCSQWKSQSWSPRESDVGLTCRAHLHCVDNLIGLGRVHHKLHVAETP